MPPAAMLQLLRRSAAAAAAAAGGAWSQGCRCFSASAAAAAAAAALDTVDCVVVGAGVIGLACARAAALAGFETLILESEPSFGTLTSSRHSEVIHAGIYYPAGSSKARLCVEGKWLMYDYCKSKGVPHSNIGKLIVATSESQIPKLKQLQQFAAANSVPDLQLLSGSEATALEPALKAVAALLSQSTGILDSHAYMSSLLQDAESAGAVLATHSRLLGAVQVPGGVHLASTTNTNTSSSSSRVSQPLLQLNVQDTTSGQLTTLATRQLINAAGLSAQAVAASLNVPATAIPQQHLAKGNYFSLSSSRAPFNRLIYPLPEDGGLGVHLTLDLGGRARFGPDVEWVSHAHDYSVDPERAKVFYPAIRSYYPDLPDDSLQPSYSGIRPKLSGPGQPAADFVLQGPRQHGIAGLVNLFGIESPGLTSSLAVAQAVVSILKE